MVVGLRPAGAPPSLSRRAIELSASICNKFIPQASKKGRPAHLVSCGRFGGQQAICADSAGTSRFKPGALPPIE
jgi:hypothetical protein